MALIDDPAVSALVDKSVTKALATQAKEHKAAFKALLKHIKETTTQTIVNYKNSGNKEAATVVKTFGTELATFVKESHLSAEAA